MESASFHFGSFGGKCAPMSPSAAAPRIASVTAWATASASEWPASPRSCGISTPPSTRRRPSAKRCESYPTPDLIPTSAPRPCPTASRYRRSGSSGPGSRPAGVRGLPPGAARASRVVVLDVGVVLVAATRREARVFDDAAHLAFGHDVVDPGRAHHVLLDHERAEIVGAEIQRDLRHLRPLRHVRDLDVLEIVQDETRERRGPQVVHPRSQLDPPPSHLSGARRAR